jgi:electron transport complex protein RnfC
MYRPIRQARSSAAAPPGELGATSVGAGELIYRLERDTLPRVSAGDSVAAGQLLARCDAFTVRSAVAGTVRAVAAEALQVLPSAAAVWPPRSQSPTPEAEVFADFPAFLAEIGLRGMGGALFPASLKVRASRGVKTLVVNAAECEPGLSVDRAILLQESDLVNRGARAVARAVGAERIVLALRRDAALERQAGALYEFELLRLGDRYPAGAERLVLRALTGTLPPAGILPFQLGVLLHNVASLRAIGRALRDGVPAIERPLTLRSQSRGLHRDLIVPVGMRLGDLLQQTGVELTAAEVIVTGGLMMGTAATVDTPVTLGTPAVLVVPRQQLRRPQRNCIRCGSCCDACPLGLHPGTLVCELGYPRASAAAQAQLAECFLCGCCSAVCPASLPLAEDLRRAKSVKH